MTQPTRDSRRETRDAAPDYAAQALAKLEEDLPVDNWVRVRDVATALGKHANTIREHCDQGDFYAGNRGPDGSRKIWRQSVIDWMKKDLAKGN